MSDEIINKENNFSGNVFTINAKVFLEGVEIPYSNVSVSYGIGSEPTCSISLPGMSDLRDLPEYTKVLVVYKNPHEEYNSPWYVLFDGELSSISYNLGPEGAVLFVQAVHCTNYLSLMQMIVQEASARLSGMDNIAWSGITECAQVGSGTEVDAIMLKCLFGDKGTDSIFNNMADLVYALIRSILCTAYGNSTQSSNTTGHIDYSNATKFFRKRVIDTYKLPQRISGLSYTVDEFEEKLDPILKSIATAEHEARNKAGATTVTDKVGNVEKKVSENTQGGFTKTGKSYASTNPTDMNLLIGKRMDSTERIKLKDGTTSKWFTYAEFGCHGDECKGKCFPTDVLSRILDLVPILDKLRDTIGQSLTISSGYRCEEHNKQEQGVSNSQHLYGTAADIYSNTYDHELLAQAVQNMNVFDYYKIYNDKQFIHVDIRDGASGKYILNEKEKNVAETKSTDTKNTAGSNVKKLYNDYTKLIEDGAIVD